jgi:prevent-host-death family protein
MKEVKAPAPRDLVHPALLDSVQSVQKRGRLVAWQLQAAKQHFSELVERAQRDGPQVVTKHGKEAVVVVAAEEYRRLRGNGPSLVEFIRSGPDFDALGLDRAEDRGRDVEL